MKTIVDLVRAPAALSVLGDSLAGAASVGAPMRGRRLLLPLASVALYWSGMALNDWADRALDAVERPERPIPSGRISPGAAFGTAAGLTGAGLALAGLGGGRRGFGTATALAAAIWAYDTTLKPTAFGPAGMASCRALDVLLGASGSRQREALPTVAAIGAHTYAVTALSAGEVHGAARSTARFALGTTAVAAVTALSGRARFPRDRVAAAGWGAVYAGTVGTAQWQAVREPAAPAVRAATAAGIHGMVPLQATVLARRGSRWTAALLGAGLPLARRLAKRVSPT
ncbi:4-hydroxybenzoate polyprenyltransferase [Tamaricihabitans halophyticus]|uniref:4-hydroxybenzoate polyprenyltransferase n=1 Tax=Tamaricihabitans halophyticus TaxID=1262583 RepID=A0A4R2R0G7_9PSEU|nr:UbiA family prenyltransferase [Tamaricihabitans halophyticus]TCP56110.1 4-hydroxybenzoate polyprenyltransferase [Tamaricihabitans halophyticus]